MPTTSTTLPHPADPEDFYEGRCAVCGAHGRFLRARVAIGATYQCPGCAASLRYQNQARVLLHRYACGGAGCLAELVREHRFRKLRILEPGRLGPFRRHLRELPGYEQTTYAPDVPRGSMLHGLRCEDLTDLTYPDATFDLVITSDVFEHVRHPEAGFRELHRTLRPGGAHVFTVPVRWPLRERTVARVDTSGPADVFLTEPLYHHGCLVYTDFGRDLLDLLEQVGFRTSVHRFESTNHNASRVVAFCSVKPARPPARPRALDRIRRRRQTWQDSQR